ncbi:hypothetical protein [Streptomyces sp. NPDC059389]|uniref:hypothetical protein n=1 Tax=Streptomyces sp. NPDC059389 TaxID=3346818 RepID=UPI0036CA5D1D
MSTTSSPTTARSVTKTVTIERPVAEVFAFNTELGMLDHDYVDEQASWQVPARVVANGTGSEFMITFFQPPAFTDPFFDEQIALVDTELAALTRSLEAGA